MVNTERNLSPKRNQRTRNPELALRIYILSRFRFAKKKILVYYFTLGHFDRIDTVFPTDTSTNGITIGANLFSVAEPSFLAPEINQWEKGVTDNCRVVVVIDHYELSIKVSYFAVAVEGYEVIPYCKTLHSRNSEYLGSFIFPH